MSTKLDRRLSALRTYCTRNAPKSIIIEQCRMVLEAHYNGLFKTIIALIMLMIRMTIRNLIWESQLKLHKYGFHFKSEDDPSECWICFNEKVDRYEE